jgi:hypothetical protein
MVKNEADKAIEKINKLLPVLSKTIDMTSYEKMVSEYASKAANSSDVHSMVSRLTRINSLLMALILTKNHEIRVKMVLIADLSSLISSRVEETNNFLIDLSRLKATIDTKQDYINQLDRKIEDKTMPNSFDVSISNLSKLAGISREFAPVEGLK